MAKVSVIATITAKAGRGDDIVAAFANSGDLVRGEPGTEMYMLHRNQTNPDVFYVTELYADQAALDAHTTGDGAKALGAGLGDAIESFDLQFANLVSG